MVVFVLARPALAAALPVGRIVEATAGETQLLAGEYLEAAEVEPADLARAERLPSGALRLTPLRPGSGLVYLFENGEVDAWRLYVRGPGESGAPAPSASPELWAAARAACPGVQERVVDGEHFLHAAVPDGRCRRALLALLATDLFDGSHLRLVFDLPALQAQLRDMKLRLDAARVTGLSLHYLGATLVLSGTVAPAVRRRALRLVWQETLGKVDLDDQTESPDGGG